MSELTAVAQQKQALRLKAYLAQLLNSEQIPEMCEIVDKVLLKNDTKEVGFHIKTVDKENKSKTCNGCTHKPLKDGIDSFPMECGECSRFYSDKYESRDKEVD